MKASLKSLRSVIDINITNT